MAVVNSSLGQLLDSRVPVHCRWTATRSWCSCCPNLCPWARGCFYSIRPLHESSSVEFDNFPGGIWASHECSSKHHCTGVSTTVPEQALTTFAGWTRGSSLERGAASGAPSRSSNLAPHPQADQGREPPTNPRQRHYRDASEALNVGGSRLSRGALTLAKRIMSFYANLPDRVVTVWSDMVFAPVHWQQLGRLSEEQEPPPWLTAQHSWIQQTEQPRTVWCELCASLRSYAPQIKMQPWVLCKTDWELTMTSKLIQRMLLGLCHTNCL